VREALRVLRAKGLIAARPKRGTLVQPRSAWNLLDRDILYWQFEMGEAAEFLDNLTEVRRLIEPGAARLAAKRRNKEDVDDISLLIAEMGKAGTDMDRFIDADLRFHQALLRATHNELLTRLEVVIGVGLLARDRFVRGVRAWTEAVPSHIAVAEAVFSADEDGAEAAMNALLGQAEDDITRARKRQSAQRSDSGQKKL
jgi:DNA-binding FadR family transcriptional regulator